METNEQIDITKDGSKETQKAVFSLSSRVQRSPPPQSPQSVVLVQNRVNATSSTPGLGAIALEDSAQAVERTMRENTEQTMNSGLAKERQLIKRCKEIISLMKKAADRQRNMSNDVKQGLVELEDAIDGIAFGAANWYASVIQACRSTETQQPEKIAETGVSTPSGSKKRVASSPADQKKEKRLREVASTDDWEINESRREKNLRKKRQKEAERRGSESTNPKPAATPSAQGRPKKRRAKIRPDALLVKPAEGQTYAEVLRELRSKVRPDEAEAEVTAIRKTRAGEVLIELGQSTKSLEGFRDLLSTTLGKKGRVVNLGARRIQVEIRDLDSYTMKEEVTDAIKREVPAAEEVSVMLFPCARDQQVAVVEMSGKAALKLIKSGKIKIGWTVCRVRERAVATRCFKCIGYGHVARNCDGPDRSKLCYKCLGTDHKAKTCTAVARCVLCEVKGYAQEELAHTSGTGKCKVYREALQEAKNRR